MENSISTIEIQIRQVREMCQEHIHLLEDNDEKALMTTTAEVLNGLEKAIHSCFHDQSHSVSPKSTEPWD